jgi:hypothetical protein
LFSKWVGVSFHLHRFRFGSTFSKGGFLKVDNVDKVDKCVIFIGFNLALQY